MGTNAIGLGQHRIQLVGMEESAGTLEFSLLGPRVQSTRDMDVR